MMSANDFSADVKPSAIARRGSKLCGQPLTIVAIMLSGTRSIRAATDELATVFSAAICSQTVTDSPGMLKLRLGPIRSLSSVAA